MLQLTQLVGFGGASDETVAAGEITFIASTTSTASATITAPATINAGDLLILADSARNGVGAPTTVVPAGFTSIINTLLDTVVSGQVRNIASYKIADGTEDGATITGMNGTITDTKIMLQFRRDPVTSVASVEDVTGEGTTGNPASQTVNALGQVPPLIVFAVYKATSSSVDPRTFSPAKDAEVNANDAGGPDDLWFAYLIYNSSPADVTVDMDDEGIGNLLQSFLIELA